MKERLYWLSVGLAGGLTAVIWAKAIEHVMLTQSYGPICGHGLDHCWACYAALPMTAALGMMVHSGLGRRRLGSGSIRQITD